VRVGEKGGEERSRGKPSMPNPVDVG